MRPSSLETIRPQQQRARVPAYAAADLGLTAANTDFQFDVLAFTDFYLDPGTDCVPTDLLVSPTTSRTRRSTSTTQLASSVVPIGGSRCGMTRMVTPSPSTYDVTGLSDLPSILLLHHHNAADAEVGRAEVVQVRAQQRHGWRIVKTVDNDYSHRRQIRSPSLSSWATMDPVRWSTRSSPTCLPTGLTYVSDTCPGTSSQSAVSGGTQIVCDMTGITIPTTLSRSCRHCRHGR